MVSSAKKITAVSLIFTAVIFILISQSGHYLSKDMNVYEKIEEGEPISYLIIGDSIGRGAGAETEEVRWYNQLEILVNDFSGSRARRHSVVQSGATAFEGIYKLDKMFKNRKMDLIFVVFGENDRKYMDPEEFSFFYEKLIRDAKVRFMDAEIITIIESPLKQEPYADAIKRISAHYGAKAVDMRIPFRKSGMLTEQLTSDNVHPNGIGYQLYAHSIFDLLKNNIRKGAGIASLPNSLSQNDFFYLAENTEVIASKGFINRNGIYTSSMPGDFLEYEFHGPILGINTIRSQDGGMMNVYIDGEFARTVSTWWPFARERHIYIASGLENTWHTVRFEPLDEVTAYNKAALIQISSIIVAKNKKANE